MAVVAGAVVLARDTARTSIRAEAVGSVFLVLALLPRLAQVGGAQGNVTKLACECGWERSLRGKKAPICPESQRSPLVLLSFLGLCCPCPGPSPALGLLQLRAAISRSVVTCSAPRVTSSREPFHFQSGLGGVLGSRGKTRGLITECRSCKNFENSKIFLPYNDQKCKI